MSYNYEKQQKNLNQSIYIYTNNELDTQTYIFELILTDKFNENQVIRRIKKSNQGNLISYNDNIQYNNINKYKLSIIDANNPSETIVIKNSINHGLTSTIFMNNLIYLEINNKSNSMMDFNYNINLHQ